MIEIKLECPGQAPRVRRFAATTITIGRATDCELCLEDPSLSRRHCRITCGLCGDFVVEDLGSANGTMVAGRRIVGSVAVAPGMTITLGELRLELVGRRGARGVVATTAGPRPQDPASEPRPPATNMVKGAGTSALTRASTAALAVSLAVLGGWATAWAWDRPIELPVPVAASCRANDPSLLAADAVAEAAGSRDDVEAALRGGLRALARVRGTPCAGQSRGTAVLQAALLRSVGQRLGQHPAGLRAVVVGVDGRVLALDDAGGLALWERELPGGRVERGEAQAVARSVDRRWLAVAGKDGSVVVGADAGAMVVVARGDVVALGFADDGRLVGVLRGGELVVWRAGEDGVWAVVAEGQAWPGVTQLQVAGARVLAAGAGRAAVWQLGHLAAPLLLRTGAAITAAALDARGGQVVAGDAAGLVTRWSLGRRARSELLTAHAGAVQAVAWVGDAVASVGADDTLRVSELARRVRRDGPPLVLVAEAPVPVDRLAVGGAGRWLLGGGPDGMVVRWDLEQRSRRLPATLHTGHTGAVTALAAVDGFAVSGGADGVVRAWDLTERTGEEDTTETGLVRRACRALGWTEEGCAHGRERAPSASPSAP